MNFIRKNIKASLSLGKYKEGYYEFNDVSIDFTNKEIDLLKENKEFKYHIIHDAIESAIKIKYNITNLKNLLHNPLKLTLMGLNWNIRKRKYYLPSNWKIKSNPKIRGFKGLVKVYGKTHTQDWSSFRYYKAIS